MICGKTKTTPYSITVTANYANTATDTCSPLVGTGFNLFSVHSVLKIIFNIDLFSTYSDTTQL